MFHIRLLDLLAAGFMATAMVMGLHVAVWALGGEWTIEKVMLFAVSSLGAGFALGALSDRLRFRHLDRVAAELSHEPR